MKKKRNILFTIAMIFMGIFWFAGQNSKAADYSQAPALTVDGQWSQTFYVNEDESAYYKFTIPSDGRLTWKFMSYIPYTTSLFVRDENLSSLNQVVMTNSGNPDTGRVWSKALILSKGTYYINLRCDSAGNHKICLSFESFNVNDGNAVSYRSPQTISVGEEINGALTRTDVEDWFKIVVPKTGSYTYRIMADTYLYNDIYNEDLTKRIGSNTMMGVEDDAKIWTQTYELEAGTYYIKIQAYDNYSQGKYSLLVKGKECSHTYTAKKVKATYFSKGYTIYTCSKCQYTYQGSYVAKLKIPKGSVTNIRSGKKKLTLRWKKIKNVTGYEIRYSPYRNFKKNVTVKKITNKNLSRRTITKLKSKKTYYVQIRGYAKKDGKTIYGKWSSTKKVKIK